MLKYASFALAVGVLALATFFLSSAVTRLLIAQSGPSTVFPYTIQMDIYDLSGPVEKLQYPAIYARRSDGTKLYLSYAGGSLAWGQVIRQIDYPDGRQKTLYDKLGVKSSYEPRTLIDLKTQAAHRALEAGPCENIIKNATKLRDDSFLGFPATVVQRKEGPDKRVTYWKSPTFGCMSLKYTVETLNQDLTWVTTFEGRSTSATLAEPEASLFDPGDTYATVSDAEAENRLAALAPSTAH